MAKQAKKLKDLNQENVNDAPAEAKAEAKPKKEKKVKPKAPQLPKHLDELTIEEQEQFLTEHGHMGEGMERPDDITGYILSGIEDKTFKQGKKTPKSKLPKVEPVYEWADETQYAGRQVFTSRGTSRIVKESTDGQHFQVQTKSGELFAVKSATTRFKAVNEGYRDRYIKDETIRTESGSPSIHSGSDISYALLGATTAELSGVAKENGLTERFNGWRESGKNNGMLRMNLGNVLAAMVRRGEPVSIFGEGDLKIARQKGEQRAHKEAEAAKARKAEAAKERSAKAEEAKAKKAAEKEAKAKAKADKEEAAKSKKAEKEQAKVEKKAKLEPKTKASK